MYQVTRTERGWAAHFIMAERCKFRRNTLLTLGETTEGIIVSTVGSYYDRDGELITIGWDRYYETKAFQAIPRGEYIEIDEDKIISFNSPWAINKEQLNSRIESIDNLANDMHETVVMELNSILTNTGMAGLEYTN